MTIKGLAFALVACLFGVSGFFVQDASAINLHPCPCSTEAQWQMNATSRGTGDHYLYSLEAQDFRKYNVHLAGGGTIPQAVGESDEARIDIDASSATPQGQTLIADPKPVEPMYLDAFSEWVVAWQLTGGSMKTAVTYDLGANGTPNGFPGSVSNGTVYDFALRSSSRNDLLDWIESLTGRNNHDLPTDAVRALAALANSVLSIDESASIEFLIKMPNGQKIYVTWRIGQPHPEITGLRDANNNTVPRTPGDVRGDYDFSRRNGEYGDFLNFLGRMGVPIGSPGNGGAWVVACTTAGGVTRCVPMRAY